MDKMTKTLFGGALLTAGMGVAQAQEFTLPGNVPPYANTITQAYVYDYYTIGNVGGYTIDGGFGDSYSVSNAYGSGSASINSNSLSADSNGFGNTDFLGGAFAQAYGYLSVTQDAVLNMAWDFTGEGGFGPLGNITVIDWSAGGVVVFATDAFTAGSDSITLFAGTNYGIDVTATSAQGTSAFASAVLVPAPGAMGLLGAAGLVAARRRR
ncbi:MAG: PEP-CTERM sorting domain-containing protein [Planctomycetota bacterium]